MAAPSIRTHGKPLRRREVPRESGARCLHSTNTLRNQRGTEARGQKQQELAMARPIKLHALRVPEVDLRAYHRDLILVKMNFLLWGWNWTSYAIIQEWDDNGLPKPPGYRGHPDTSEIWDYKKVLGQCASDNGDLTFDSDSVRITRDEERAYADLFKHPRTGKNEYRTVWYRDRMRQNIEMALMQILRPQRPTYMMTWQRKLSKEVEKRRKTKQVGDSLCEDVKRAKCASVNLRKRLESCRTAYDAESLKVDELQAAAELIVTEQFDGPIKESEGFTRSGLRYRLPLPSSSVVAEASGVADSGASVVISSSVLHSFIGDIRLLDGLFQHFEDPSMDDYHEFVRDYAVKIDAWRRCWSPNNMSITQDGVGISGGASGSIIEGTNAVDRAGTSNRPVSIASGSTSEDARDIHSFNPVLEFLKRLRKN
ncbi:hypothetical protein AXG93_1293s1060 [Marchantia polymorpha subsp. ruderalis]|uniref:Uncharacterized protein n=1 Tax=Marchantia polymorpha subsp. ruderalis TaxID=1480154 RepID=A0A176WDS3_MARPO|nr:hypothetical protein AXG93_1293s1060 [Marchantia polymorpha subsp. ruderalis]